MPLPLVSIVTPALNSGEFLEETIQSVLSQDYPRIEYLVMDGGSTDGSLAILERYRDRLRYLSQPDQGTADAINRGFRQCRGDILAWLSADDCYLPGAVAAAAARLAAEPAAAVVYGEGYWVDESGRTLGRYPTAAPYTPAMFCRECSICQPAAFFRREAVEAVGLLDPALHSAFDYDLWIRLSRNYSFTAIPQYLALSRMHNRNKSLGQKGLMFEECIQLLRRHYDYVPPQLGLRLPGFPEGPHRPVLLPRPQIRRHLSAQPRRRQPLQLPAFIPLLERVVVACPPLKVK